MAQLTIPYQFGPTQSFNSVQNNANFLAIQTFINTGQIGPDNIGTKIAYAATNTQEWGAGVTGDTNPRIVMNTSHGLQGGSGSAAPDVDLFRSAANTWKIQTAGGGAATLNMNGGTLDMATGAITNSTNSSLLIFGGRDNIRPLPTSGTITGEYTHLGNWVQTGTITSNQARIHLTGTMEINNTWTVNTDTRGGTSLPGSATVVTSGSNGAGWGGGQCNAGLNAVSGVGGGGGGFGGPGGNGGAGVTNNAPANSGGNYTIYSTLSGSGGGGGTGFNSSAGGNGGNGGGSLYIEVTGNLTCTAACAMTANGGNGTSSGATSTGSGGGGSGGGIQIRCLGSVTLTAGGSMTATGGTGANAPTTGAAGGGGGGGYIDISGTSVTSGFTPTAGGGAAGTGGTTAATAGTAGVVNLNSFVQNVRSAG